MTIKTQIQTVKENWLIAAVLLIAFILFSGLSNPLSSKLSSSGDMQYPGNSYEKLSMSSGIVPGYPQDFAPEVSQRDITKSASLSTEVKRGTFKEADSKVKSIVSQNNAIILNENSNSYGEDRNSYLESTYTIKVESSKYPSFIDSLKNLGNVKSFTENTDDITKTRVDTESTLEAEKERLARYNKMYDGASSVQEKIDLSDRIFNQERTIKYYEDSLNNIKNQVSYSTISLSITEKQSDYANTIFVNLSDLVNSFVESLNNLLKFFVVILPWAVITFILYLLYRRFTK